MRRRRLHWCDAFHGMSEPAQDNKDIPGASAIGPMRSEEKSEAKIGKRAALAPSASRRNSVAMCELRDYDPGQDSVQQGQRATDNSQPGSAANCVIAARHRLSAPRNLA